LIKKGLILLSVFFTSLCHGVEENAMTAVIANYLDGELPLYEVAYYDLNVDGFDDAFVYLADPNWCGTGGCTALIFKGTKSSFVFLSKIMIVDKPVIILDSMHYGWSDIVVNTHQVGTVILAFDGQSYPLNPSLQPLCT
jgi:hypothetical protein